jgi:replicative DNA helicase
MLRERSRVEPIAERIGPDSFREPLYREIFAALLEVGEEGSITDLAALLDSDALSIAEEMLEGESMTDVQRTVDDSITRLNVREMEEHLNEIDRLLPLASPAEQDGLQQERAKLVAQMRASGRMAFKAFRAGRTR